MFTNGVGRPSNETIKKRNIFKGMCVILVLVIIGMGLYILTDKGYVTIGKQDKENKNDQATTIVTTNQTTTKSVEKFDKSKVTTEKADGDFINVYVYGKKIDIEGITQVFDIKTMDDKGIISLTGMGDVLVIYNTKGEELYTTYVDGDLMYCGGNEITSECYGTKVNDNKITFFKQNLGQESSTTCKDLYNYPVLIEYEIEYKDGVFTKEKEISSITGKEYSKKHNIDCSNYR